MWAEVKADQVIKVFRSKALTVNGIQHPSGIFSKWTKEKLAEIGMFPYVIQKTGDIRFQKEGSVEYKIESDKVIGITSYKDRDMEDFKHVDKSGDPILGSNGKQIVTLGLKSKYINEVNKKCYNILCETDWYVVKHTEIGTDIPSDIKTFRASVRTKANALETSIKACSSFDDLKVILDPPDKDTNAPFQDWPEL